MPVAVVNQATQAQSQVDLFAAAPAIEVAAESAVEAWAKALKPDDLSPREALEALYQLKSLVGKG